MASAEYSTTLPSVLVNVPGRGFIRGTQGDGIAAMKRRYPPNPPINELLNETIEVGDLYLVEISQKLAVRTAYLMQLRTGGKGAGTSNIDFSHEGQTRKEMNRISMKLATDEMLFQSRVDELNLRRQNRGSRPAHAPKFDRLEKIKTQMKEMQQRSAITDKLIERLDSQDMPVPSFSHMFPNFATRTC